MLDYRTQVTATDLESTDSGMVLEIRIRRSWMTHVGVKPSAADVPPDFRAALLAWLNEGGE